MKRKWLRITMLLQCYCHAVAVRLSGCLSVCLLPPSPCFLLPTRKKRTVKCKVRVLGPTTLLRRSSRPWARQGIKKEEKTGKKPHGAKGSGWDLPEVLRDAVALTGQEAGAAPSCSTERALFGRTAHVRAKIATGCCVLLLCFATCSCCAVTC